MRNNHCNSKSQLLSNKSRIHSTLFHLNKYLNRYLSTLILLSRTTYLMEDLIRQILFKRISFLHQYAGFKFQTEVKHVNDNGYQK
jgi:hypothetical protein